MTPSPSTLACRHLLGGLLVVLMLAAPAAADEPPPRTDRHGDPLPPGAIARLGTLRFRGVRGCLAYSPDGKLLAASSGPAAEQVTLFDAATGRAVRHFKGNVATLRSLSFAPDGTQLLLCGNSTHCRVLDATTGRDRVIFAGARSAFARDGKVLVTADAYGNPAHLHVFDVEARRLLRHWPIGDGVGAMALAPDGRTVALLGRKDADPVELRDLDTGATLRTLRQGPGNRNGLAFAPDGKTLLVSSYQRIEVWDVTTGKVIGGWNRRTDSPAVFAPDGKSVAWTGYDEKTGIARLWVAERERGEPRVVGEPMNSFEAPCFSPDGRVLAVATDAGAIRLWDVASGKEALPQDAHSSPILGLAFTPDGRHVVSRDRHELRAWETRSGRPIHRIPSRLSEYELLTALLPDGRLLTEDRTAQPAQGLFRLRDAVTGKEVLRFEGRPDNTYGVALAAGGRYVALASRGPEIGVLDLRAGRCLYRHNTKGYGCKWLSSDGDVLIRYLRGQNGFDFHIRHQSTGASRALSDLPKELQLNNWLDRYPAVSPDCRWLLLFTKESRLRRWDLFAGKEMPELPEPQLAIWSLHWSPDSRLVAAHGSARKPWEKNHEARNYLRVWDVTTGRRVPHLELADDQHVLLFAPDSRTLFSTGPQGIILWEVATGKERLRLPATAVNVLAPSADGRLLATGGTDGQVLVWDLAGCSAEGPWRVAPLRDAWGALAADDAQIAYRAQWRLAASPGVALALLREQLRPVAPPPDPGRLDRLVADLGSDNFAARQRATRELGELGELAVPALRRALAGSLSLEGQRRVEKLLETLEDNLLSGEPLRALRATEVLERIGTRAAQGILKTLADGYPDAGLTRAARAALARSESR